MKFAASFFVTAAMVGQALGHARVIGDWVDGVFQGNGAGVYIRQPPSNSPVKKLNSQDVRCNVGGTTALTGSVTVPAGSTIEPEWFHDNRGDDIIDGTHVGPIVTYLAPAATNGEGDVWVKIAEEGFDGSKWAVTKLIANKGRHSVKVPSTLAPGNYIMRVEILALHESDSLESQTPARGIQLYPSCHQLKVTGSGSTTLPAGVAFPGEYTDTTPGIQFNVYSADPKTYVIPGPKVWDGVTGGSAPPAPSSSAAPTTSVTPVTSSTKAPVTSETSVPTSSTIPVDPPAPSTVSSTIPTAPSSTAAEPTIEPTVEPTTIPAEPTTIPAEPTTTIAEPTTTIAEPTPSSTTITPPAESSSGTIVDANVCWRNYNRCLDNTQPQPDFTGCSATRDTCLVGARYMRLARDGKFGRLL